MQAGNKNDNIEIINEGGMFTLCTDFLGQNFHIETGLLATQATSSVKVTLGGTTILTTITIGIKKDADYLPFQVVYEERYYASGKFKDSLYSKRESKPSDNAILSGRIIDRSLRSNINKNIRNDIQAVTTVLQLDKTNKPDLIGVFATSLALKLAQITNKSNIFTYNKKISFYFWDFSCAQFLNIKLPSIEDFSQLSQFSHSVFENDSVNIYALLENDYNDDIIVLVSGISKDSTNKKLETDEDINIKLCFKIINVYKLYLQKIEELSDNILLNYSSLEVIDFKTAEQSLFSDPVSAVRVTVSKTSLFKSYISALLKKLDNKTKFLDIEQNLVIIIWHSLFNEEVESLIFSKLNEVSDQLAKEFKLLALKLKERPFFSLQNIELDEDLIEYKINPSYDEISESDLELIVSGDGQNISMIESEANFIPRSVIVKGIELANSEIQNLCLIQSKFIKYVLDNSVNK